MKETETRTSKCNHFNIQRSLNGNNFVTIEKVAAKIKSLTNIILPMN